MSPGTIQNRSHYVQVCLILSPLAIRASPPGIRASPRRVATNDALSHDPKARANAQAPAATGIAP